MKVGILDVRRGAGRDPSKSYTVAYRNLVALRDHFCADLFVNAADIPEKSDYDVIICGFGSTSCEKDLSTDFLKRNKKARVFWLVGEYEQSTFAPLFYSGRSFEVIKNFEHPIRNKKCIKQHFLNINTLLASEQRGEVRKKYGCVYYGRWRPDRLRYFQQYLDSSLYLSTHSKNIKMFHHNGCNPKLIKPLSWAVERETLSLFSASLYIEDVFTHSNYNCLGNRFYEAIACNTVPLFDISCKNTLERSGIRGFESYIVESPADIAEVINTIGEDERKVMSEWRCQALEEKDQVLADMGRIFNAE